MRYELYTRAAEGLRDRDDDGHSSVSGQRGRIFFQRDLGDRACRCQRDRAAGRRRGLGSDTQENPAGLRPRPHHNRHRGRQHPRRARRLPRQEAPQALQLSAGESGGERSVRRLARHAARHDVRDHGLVDLRLARLRGLGQLRRAQLHRQHTQSLHDIRRSLLRHLQAARVRRQADDAPHDLLHGPGVDRGGLRESAAAVGARQRVQGHEGLRRRPVRRQPKLLLSDLCYNRLTYEYSYSRAGSSSQRYARRPTWTRCATSRYPRRRRRRRRVQAVGEPPRTPRAVRTIRRIVRLTRKRRRRRRRTRRARARCSRRPSRRSTVLWISSRYIIVMLK
ncbi:unnamed protein product [Trichogramma brassicae]|uniref:Uncharacterized protein n=1 Tax=Trichogramma brassicae TaxID=86971 RepID=A0A6H5J6S4_9HYME|nr:unnamed protein product [Trichogramma brassicae]